MDHKLLHDTERLLELRQEHEKRVDGRIDQGTRDLAATVFAKELGDETTAAEMIASLPEHDRKLIPLLDEAIRRSAIFRPFTTRKRGERFCEFVQRTDFAPALISASQIADDRWRSIMLRHITEADRHAVEFDIDAIAAIFHTPGVGNPNDLPLFEDLYGSLQKAGEAAIPLRTPYEGATFTFHALTVHDTPTITSVIAFSVGEQEESATVLFHYNEMAGLIPPIPIGVSLLPTHDHRTCPAGGFVPLPMIDLEPNIDLRYQMMTAGLVAHTLMLMGCRNVTLADDARIKRSRQEWRQRERDGIEETERKRIVLKLPGQKQPIALTGEGSSDANTKRHMVRGHFSTYTEQAPLFGKVAGTFWIPAHIRGNRGSATEPTYEVREREDA